MIKASLLERLEQDWFYTISFFLPLKMQVYESIKSKQIGRLIFPTTNPSMVQKNCCFYETNLKSILSNFQANLKGLN